MSLPIAEKWYTTQCIAPDLTLILEQHIDPGWRCNIWHLRGRERDLLIDSGMGIVPLKAEVATLTRRPLTCVATHAHFDHVGAHHEFVERIAHRAEAEILAAPTRFNTVAEDYITLDWFAAVPPAGFDPDAYEVLPAPPTRTVEDGDVIDLGDRVLEVMHLPGHSPGSIALWEPGSRTLFSGDVMYDGELFDRLYHSDISHYRRSLRRLRGLPVDVVHAGHFGSFGRERLHALIDAQLARWAAGD